MENIKDILESGMVCETREGKCYLFIEPTNMLIGLDSGLSIYSYNENMEHMKFPDLDIIRIYDGCGANSLERLLTCSPGELIWEREPELIAWRRVKIDTPIFVSNDGKEWERAYFSGFDNGKIYAFARGRTSWSAQELEVVSWKKAKLAEQENNKASLL